VLSKPGAAVDVASDAQVLSRGVVFLASMILVVYVIRSSHVGLVFDATWIDSQVRGHGLRGELMFLVVATLLASIGLPRQVVSFTAGYAFGFVDGLLMAMVASVCMCVATFFYSRFLGRAFVARHFADKVRRVDAFLGHNPFASTLLLRFLPVGSNLATNLAGGLSSARAVLFLAASAVGYVPQTAVFALLGSGIEVDPVLRTGLSLVLFIVSALLGLYLYRRHRHDVTAMTKLEERGR